MKKRGIVFASIFFITFLAFFFKNIGYILDISESPKKADSIVVLGGDWDGYRVKKAVWLYKNGFANHIIVNENSKIDLNVNGKKFKKEIEFLKGSGIPDDSITLLRNAGNTMFELRALKKTALSLGFHSLLIVSAPPHLKRVELLANSAADFKKDGIAITLISSDPPWWSKSQWYKNNTARNFVVSEMIKIISNYITYILLEKNHLLEPTRQIVGPLITPLKEFIQKVLREL